MKKWLVVPQVLFAVAMGPGVADAAYLRYEITGVVTEVVMPGLTSIVLGDTWRATVYVDEAAPDAFPGTPAIGRYASTSGTMTLGASLAIDSFLPYIEIMNDDPADFVLIEQYPISVPACIDSFCVSSIQLDYTDLSRTALQNDSLAGTIGLSIDDFESLAEGDPVPRNSFIVKFRESLSGRIGGAPTGLEVTRVDAVPLPPTLWLAATGLSVLAAQVARRRRLRKVRRTA